MQTPSLDAPGVGVSVTVPAFLIVAAAALYVLWRIDRRSAALHDRAAAALDDVDVVEAPDDGPPPPPWAVSPTVDVEGPQAAPPAGTGADLPGCNLGGHVVALDDSPPQADAA